MEREVFMDLKGKSVVLSLRSGRTVKGIIVSVGWKHLTLDLNDGSEEMMMISYQSITSVVVGKSE